MRRNRLLLIVTTITTSAAFCTSCTPSVLSIYIEKEPNKTEYIVGEKFDPTGMVVMAKFGDNNEQEVTSYTYSPNDKLSLENEYVVIKYGSKTCAQEITVSDNRREQIGIEVTTLPNHTVYNVGEEFDPTGMVVKKLYIDGTGDEISDYEYSPDGPLSLEDDEIEITSGEFSTLVNISVVENKGELLRIEAKTLSSKTYYEGDSFDKSAVKVTAIYENATAEIQGYSVTPSTLALTTTKVTLSFEGKTTTVNVTVIERPSDDYYKGIKLNSSTLLNDLQELNSGKRKRTIGYDGLKTLYAKTDIDPDGSGKIVGFYDNKLIGPAWDSAKTWNREHVWPDSLGGGSVDGDAYMPRPTWVHSNSDRGNKYYAESGAYDPGDLGYKNYRGIAARIIFYCVVANPSLKIIDALSGGKNQMGKLSDLLKWNLEYPPTTLETAALELRVEQQRNTVISQSDIQGNRNPFVDHPEYACKIWGTTNDSTKKICGVN